MLRRAVVASVVVGLQAVVYAQSFELPVTGPVKMLFVGNSYTQHAGGMDSRIEAIAAADSPAITITADQAIVFASDVDAYWNSGSGPNMIRNNNYDIVVLQGWEYGGDTSNHTNTALFYEYMRKFGDLCDSVGALPIIFTPWAMTSHNWFNAFMRYVPANDSVGRMLNAPVLSVGREWWDLRTGRPHSYGTRPSVGGVTLDSLFTFSDAIHPNDSGQYVNALYVYTFITAKNPRSIGPSVSGFTLSEEFQDTIQNRVWKCAGYDITNWYGSTAIDNGQLRSVGQRAAPGRQVFLRVSPIVQLNGAVRHGAAERSAAPGVFVLPGTRPDVSVSVTEQ